MQTAEPTAEAPRRRRRLIVAAVVALPALTCCLAWRPVLRAIPGRLVEREEPVAADAIVVLAGDSSGARVDKAAALFLAGSAPTGKLIVSGGPIYGKLSWAELMRDQAVALGVPEERIALQDRSMTTTEDADFSAPLLAGAKTVILVTSPSHSRRAAAEFRRALGPGVRVVSCPSRDEVPEEWWRDAVATRAVVTEMLKWMWPG